MLSRRLAWITILVAGLSGPAAPPAAAQPARDTAAPAAARQTTTSRADLWRILARQDPRAARGTAGAPIKIVGRSGTVTVAPDEQRITLRPGEVIGMRVEDVPEHIVRSSQGAVGEAPAPPPPPPVDTAAEAAVLPFVFFTPAPATAGLLALRPTVFAERRMRFRESEGDFAGTLSIALVDSANPRERRPLETPIALRLVADAADSVVPGSLEISHTNFPVSEVRVTMRAPTDSLRIHVVPQFDLGGVDVWMPVQPALVVEGPEQLQGLGLQDGPVTVRLRGATVRDSLLVGLSTTRGSLEHSEIMLGRSGSATTQLRSAGRGPALLRAEAPGVAPGHVAVAFVLPYVFLLSATLGGALGGLAAGVYARKKQQGGESLPLHVLAGLLIGLVAAIIYAAIGVNISQFEVRSKLLSEGAVFAFAALVALTGIALKTNLAPAK